MATVGSGTIKLRDKYSSMEEITMDILTLVNTPSIAQHRLDEIYGRNKRTGMDIEDMMEVGANGPDFSFVEQQEERAVAEMLDSVRKSWILKNILGIISSITDRQDKIIALIFLMSNTTLFTTNPDEFKLQENINTEYTYIIDDNKNINKKLAEIYKTFLESSSAVDDLKAKFEASVDKDVSDILLEYPNSALMENSTGNFYKILRKQLGERFTKGQKEAVSDFLTEFKALQKDLAKGSAKMYCANFGIPYNVYMNEKIRSKALEPIDQLSGSGLLV